MYDLEPKVYIAYDRLAYFEKGNDDLRISFDTNIRTRRSDLLLESGDHGKRLLDSDVWLMEIKTSLAKPLWLCEMLSEFENSFIKFFKIRYGVQKYDGKTKGNAETKNICIRKSKTSSIIWEDKREWII